MPEDYFSHSRPEVRALVPPGARRVVDVGCGAGAMGAALKSEHPGVEVRGIELNGEAAARARQVLDDVAVAPGESGPPLSWPAPDCVILADVLEHMTDPWTALRRWGERLGAGGRVVVSLPNIGHISVLAGLWRGRWDYADEGLLDRTHLRFFTRATAIELIEGAGLEIEEMRRALLPPGGLAGRLVARACLAHGLERERRGRPVPAWLLRILDTCTYEILIRAKVSEKRTATAGRSDERALRAAPPSP